MTNPEKARFFLAFQASKDSRCSLLLMMLSFAVGLPESDCLNKIRELATQ